MRPTFDFVYHSKPKSTDMVVFVHGLVGDLVGTWCQFPALIASDPYLPDLDILLCGYRSRLLGPDPDILRVGRRVLSAVEQDIEPDARLFLVGHSMGGLIILAGLVDACRDGHAQKPPVANLQWVTLIASPTMGSELAAGYKYLLSLLRFLPTRIIAWLLSSRQVRQLARGRYIDELMREVAHRLYCTDIPATDTSSRRFVNVRVVLGDEDHIVEESSARGIFYRLPPRRVTGTHSTVKEPADHRDPRYRAVANDVATGLREDFTTLCSLCLREDREAQVVFDQRWQRAIDYRLEIGFPDRKDVDQERESLRRLTWHVALKKPELAPGRAFDTALMMLTQGRSYASR